MPTTWQALLLACLFKLAASNVSVNITNHWDTGFEGSICINITKELDGWIGHLIFSQDVGTVESWAAKVTKLSSREFTLESNSFIAQQHVGAKLCFAFEAHETGNIKPTTIFYIEGMDGPGGNSSASQHTGGGTPSKDYADALGKSILFYDAQRSGKLPANNPIKWRGDSAVNDCDPGGWYDAGDHVKFGLPLASTTTFLLWSLYSFKDGYVKAGQLDMMYDMIKWPLDYLLKAWNPTTMELTAQVGDGNVDHKFWGRPEQMTMARPCLVISAASPGSDVAAETAASLALGAITFKDKGDTAYSAQLLSAAESLYAFAKAHRGKFSGSGQFYSSSGDPDEMCEASIWLYRATGNKQYLADATTFVEVAWGWAIGWDDKKARMCSLPGVLYEETKNSDYKNAVVGFMQGWLPGGTTTYTPCGLAWRDTWGANRYAGNTAFFALIAAEAGITPGKYRAWAIEQINYMLGDNKHYGGCYSFEIGYGTKYPLQPHHRGASCPDMPAPCDQSNLAIDAPSPHVLVGALVGGPDTTDAYEDKRTDYIHNEVAIDYNSGFQGALAGILHLIQTNNFPPTNNKCPCKS